MNTGRQGTPWWMWVLGGCGCLTLVVTISFVGLGWMGVKWAKQTAETMSDPAKRDEAARSRFGTDSLPEGWHAAAVFSVPMFADIVVLADRVADEPTADGGVEPQVDDASQALIFASVRDIGGQREKWRTALETGSDPKSTGVQLPVGFGSSAFAKGSFGMGGSDVTWAAYYGNLDQQEQQRSIPARVAAALVECPNHPRVELVAWAVPMREGDSQSGAEAGLPGDENALRDLLELFPVCGDGG